ncbi:MAG: hypothetical protein JO235_01890 [Chroococcidiopsidaceae cyanobacterium CP_BM_RX_35]|nr:hypothetical protein [Chroococcidiopsidaceae cyanobacterium CP_BM_RX_35]
MALIGAPIPISEPSPAKSLAPSNGDGKGVVPNDVAVELVSQLNKYCYNHGLPTTQGNTYNCCKTY